MSYVDLIGIARFLIIVSAAIVVHELGHFYRFRRYGVPIKAFYVGLPFYPKFTFYIKNKITGLQTKFVISPWLVAGGINPGKDWMEKLPDSKITKIANGGILANTASFFLFWGILEVKLGTNLIGAGLLVAFLIVIFRFIFDKEKAISVTQIIKEGKFNWVLPFTYSIIFIVAVGLIATNPLNSVGGPIMLYNITNYCETFWDGVIAFSITSFALASTNILPLRPLDGWIVTANFLKQKGVAEKTIASIGRIGLSLLIAILSLAIASDVAKLIYHGF